MKEIWKQQSFRWYLLGLFLSGLGDQFGWVALSWFVLHKTNSTLAMGGVILAYNLTAALASLLAGVLLDRFNRRKLIMADNLLRGFIFIAIVAVMSSDSLPLAFLYPLIVLGGLLSPLSSSGSAAMLPRLIGDQQLLSKANGLIESQGQFTYLFGPSLAGILIARYGEAAVLLLDALSFFLCAFCFFRIKGGEGEGMQSAELPSVGAFFRSLFADLKVGYAYLISRRPILWLAFFTFLFYLAYGPFEVALPVYADQKLAGGAVALGLLWTAFAVGSLAGSLLFASVNWRIPIGYTMAGIIVLWGAATFPFAVTDHLAAAMAAIGLGGLSYAPYTVLYRTYLQKHLPEELLGRVMTSLRTVTGLGMPLGAYAAGTLIPATGLEGLFASMSLACIAVGLIAFWKLKPLR